MSPEIGEVYSRILTLERLPEPPMAIYIPSYRASLMDFTWQKFGELMCQTETSEQERVHKELNELARWVSNLCKAGVDPGKKYQVREAPEGLMEDFLNKLGHEVHLSAQEERIFEVFCRYPYELITYEDLLREDGLSENGPYFKHSKKLLQNVVSHIRRRKLEPEKGGPSYIISVYKQGYIFRPDPTVQLVGEQQRMNFTLREQRVLTYFFTHFGEPRSRGELLNIVGGTSDTAIADSLRLQRKIGPFLRIRPFSGYVIESVSRDDLN